MIITQKGVVDITPEYNRALRPVFCVSEGDKTSRRIVLTVMRGGEAFLIPSGATVYIIGKKSDSNIFTYRCNYSGSDVTFDITEQMSAASGIVLCELQINLSGEVLGSANFVYWTEPAPIENGTYSESDLNIMLEAIAGAERLDNFYAGIEDMVADAVEQIQIMPGQVVIDPTLLVNGAAADAAATGNAVRSFLNALITETTAEATIATCDDAAGGLPLKKIVANIVPSQSGTGDPSPDNVRPISGYTGVTVTRKGRNLFDDSLRVSNSSHTTVTLGQIYGYGNPKVYLKAGTYTASVYLRSGVTTNGYIKTTDPTIDSKRIFQSGSTSGSFTLAQDALVAFYAYNPDGIEPSDIIKAQLEIGDTATEYEPYNGATYAVNFPSAAGTVYGGTLSVNDDGSGTLTVDKASEVFDGSSDEAWAAMATANIFRAMALNPLPLFVQGGTTLMSDRTSVSHYNYNNMKANYPCVSYNSDGRLFLAIGDDYTEASQCTAWLAENPIQVCYTIAEPVTYALSAVEVAQMLSGVNNVWTDAAGTLNVEYYANTALYVEKIVNAQKRMITGVEESMTATKNYAIGDLLIVGTTLYRTTAAIASGAAITVGTNVTETTVAEQLLALA